MKELVVLGAFCSIAAGTLITAQAVKPQAPRPVFPPDIHPAWQVVGQSGPVKTVYVSPDGLRDRAFVAGVLSQVVGADEAAGHVEINLFDDHAQTPKVLPANATQLLHLRAKYVRAASGERFVWIKVTPGTDAKPKIEETEDNIRPGRVG